MSLPCLLDGCNKPIPKARLNRGALFCCEKCQLTDRDNRRVEARAAKSGKEARKCKVRGCPRKFLDSGTTQGYCRKHAREYGAYAPKYKKEYKTVKKTDFRVVKDFRTTICLRDGSQCRNFSKCSDSVIEHDHGAFKYQTNGGVDCWEKPNDRVPYASNLNTANSLIEV